MFIVSRSVQEGIIKQNDIVLSQDSDTDYHPFVLKFKMSGLEVAVYLEYKDVNKLASIMKDYNCD